ncbi:methionine--tRNA ligase [Xenorhabdus siamensis]|uniref:methionine--tRNA ligase n=1 Tax=Xenorhabdus siamensis TaxID=3136254 RepID=UPI0030F49F55
MNSFIVTITPPTPNGDLHVGHIAGPFLNADIFSRAQKIQGAKSYLISYSDDYQSYLERKALETGHSASKLAKENARKINESLKLIDINLDNWLESYENQYFINEVSKIFENARNKNLIAFKKSLEPYCSDSERWGYEAFARGECNHCGHSSDASQCESCAMPPDAQEMRNLKNVFTGKEVIFKEIQRAYFLLSKIQNALKERILSSPMRKSLREWVENIFRKGLKDWGISRPYESGLLLNSNEEHRVHTWFMGLAGYLATLKELSQLRHSQEQIENNINDTDGIYDLIKDENTYMVHFLGMDCSYSHVIGYTALAMSNPDFKYKNAYYTNAFLKLGDEDFSTSRGNAIWIRDLANKACPDSIRLYISLISPEETTEKFDIESFWVWRRDVFINVIVRMVLQIQEKLILPEKKYHVFNSLNYEGIVKKWKEYSSVNHFSAKKIANLLMDTIKLINKQLEKGSIDIKLVTLFALISEPVIPRLSSKLKKMMSIKDIEEFYSLLKAS